ncbi:hypothetical protein ES703_119437 [subsurface metagenome]
MTHDPDLHARGISQDLPHFREDFSPFRGNGCLSKIKQNPINKRDGKHFLEFSYGHLLVFDLPFEFRHKGVIGGSQLLYFGLAQRLFLLQLFLKPSNLVIPLRNLLSDRPLDLFRPFHLLLHLTDFFIRP